MKKRQRQKLPHFLGLALGLFLVWVILSGKFEAKFLLIGLFSSLAISYISLPLLIIRNGKTGRRFFVFGVNFYKLFLYFLWLCGEIFKSSVDVAKEALKPKMDYVPRIIYFSMPFENPMASVVLSNSIIMTPGTITIDVTDDGIFEVHALNQAAADGVMSGEMQRRVAALYGETCKFVPMPEAEVRDIPKEGTGA